MKRFDLLFFYFLFLTLWCGPTWRCSAQPRLEKRYEQKHEGRDQDFLVISMKETGLALVREKNKSNDGKNVWDLIVVDSALQEKWVTELAIEYKFSLIGHDYNGGNLYLLYRHGESNSGELSILKINPRSQETLRYSIRQEIDFRLTHFSVMGDKAIFGGYISKEPLVTIFDFKDNTNKIVPGFFHSNCELLDVRVNGNNTFNTLLVERGARSKKKLILKTFDPGGTQLLDDEVEMEKEKIILTGITSSLVRDEMVIVGTWGTNNTKQACGFYSITVDPFNDQQPTFYDFAQLDEFLNFLKPRRVEKIKAKEMRRRELNKLPDFRAYVNTVRIEEGPAGFTLLAEVYSTSSSNNNRYNYYSPFSNPYYGYSPYGYNPYYSNRYYSPYSYPNPNSFTDQNNKKILHSVIALFDSAGILRHDVGFHLEENKSSTAEQESDFIAINGKVSVAYKSHKEVFVKTHLWQESESEIDTVKIKLENPNETIRSEEDTNENSGLRFWYGKNFYTWGYQNIRSFDKSADDRNRFVFYINKIHVD